MAKTIRDQKISDIKNRLQMYEQSRMTVSIHQNKFAQSQYSGTQVFLFREQSMAAKSWQDAIRSSVVETLQPGKYPGPEKGREGYLPAE